MLDLYFWPTPNGFKITLFLEEASLPYNVKFVNIGRGEQFLADFLAISPNNRMPAIVDNAPAGGGAPLSVFESGAILLYLAEKTGKFLSHDTRERFHTLEWLFWQVGGLGPMFGQANHFSRYANEKIPYAIDRYSKEANRLLGVLDRRLAQAPFLAGDNYSIADMAAFPWAIGAERIGQSIDDFSCAKRWIETIRARPATSRAMAVGKERRANDLDEEAKRVLFGQTAQSEKR